MKSIKVNFYLDDSKENGSGLCPIWIRSRHNSKSLIRKSTGLLCEGEIDKETKRKKLPPKLPVDLRNKIQSLENEIEMAYHELSIDSQAITLHDVWDKLRPKPEGGASQAPRSTRIVDWIEHYINSSPYSPGYTRGVKLLRAHLTGRYTWKGMKMKTVKAFAPNLTFAELNQSKVDALSKHMADQGKSTGTILKTIKFLKQVSKMARDEGIKVGSLDFKPPKNFINKAKTEIRLTFDEILKIQSVKLKAGSPEEEVRDLFLLQCYTGFRHSDLVGLTRENINRDFIQVRQKKTGEDVFVTLHKYSNPIITKYLANVHDNTSNIFPKLGQQYYNRAIKSISDKAGLTDMVKQTSFHGSTERIIEEPKFKLIRSHTGRRSFSRLLAGMGLPEEIISEEMGHNTKSITRHYIGNSEHRERIRLVQAAWERMAAASKNSRELLKIA